MHDWSVIQRKTIIEIAMIFRRVVHCIWASCLLAMGVPLSTMQAQDNQISFSLEIRPIFVAHCFACHGPDEAAREGGLGLHQRDLALAELDSGEIGIVPGQPDLSELLRRVATDDVGERMPPEESGPPLTGEQVALIRQWIRQGAKYDTHWSYRPIKRPVPPDVDDGNWVRNPIDQFILHQLNAKKWPPAPLAPPEKLARRLALDLIGLPPTPEQTKMLVDDPTDENYERLVDELLSLPAYGEHWARMWLDLARYADSQGYAQDELRTIWPYRDWVIRAFNQDLPFDQFTIEQLAGDLLPNATNDQLVATGFHRNTMTNTEGGTDDAEFRHAAIVDRVNTTAQVWLGTTLGCAQCHTHKFDPITHEEYYQFFAIFNQTADNDQPDNRPTIPVMTEDVQQQLASLNRLIEQTAAQAAHASDPQVIAQTEKQLQQLKQQVAQINLPRTPVMRELLPDQQRQTHIAVGGAFNNPGLPVTPGLPAALTSSPQDDVDRLALAQWLVNTENPITPRVAVNRHWEQFFGIGIVETSEDFGSQGSLPSHPELLDWLAAEFVANGWSMKWLCKTIVMSNAYRQSTQTTPHELELDPRNRLVSRGPRFRLTAEQIRDYALATSGLLSPKMFGPPVHPPQPKSGLNAAFGGSLDWNESQGEDRYRRGVYTQWRRTHPYPSFMAMDATDRKVCTVRRIRTNTPVAAFVTLNDPVFVEAAAALAGQIQRHGGQTLEQQITYAFQRVVCRPPDPQEISAISQLYASTLDSYQRRPDQANKLVAAYPSESDEDRIAQAAWTVVANTLLNLDEVLTKN